MVATNVQDRDTRPSGNVHHAPWPGPSPRPPRAGGGRDRERTAWPGRRAALVVRRVRPDVLHARFGTTGDVPTETETPVALYEAAVRAGDPGNAGGRRG